MYHVERGQEGDREYFGGKIQHLGGKLCGPRPSKHHLGL